MQNRKSGWFFRRLQSGQLLALSFLGVILLGTLLLWLPWSAAGERPVTLIDALFTATSAVCVTGLTVVTTADAFSPFGQAVIMLLIQIGGLGIISFSVMMFLTVGRMPALRDRWVIESMYSGSTPGMRIWELVRLIFMFTFIAEAVGMSLLVIGFVISGMPLGQSLWFGLFHSVSAFCNAGFDLTGSSFVPFRENPLLLLAVAWLVILGGLGFAVVYELAVRARGRRRRLSINSRLVLITTALLLLIGTVAFFLLERRNSLDEMPLGGQLLNAFFQAVVPRTAGFNSVPMDVLSNASLLLTIALMYIGASPGSCGGGVRTTTVALLFVLFLRRLKGANAVNIAEREIPEKTMRRAVSVALVGILLIMASTIALLATQGQQYLHPTQRDLFIGYLFESVSALGTVGLSYGSTTSQLNLVGKLIIIGMMFAGRVGLVTMTYGLMRERFRERYNYPEEDVML